jgi:hypothetical protein
MNSLLAGLGISDRAVPGDDPVADAVTAEAVGHRDEEIRSVGGPDPTSGPR